MPELSKLGVVSHKWYKSDSRREKINSVEDEFVKNIMKCMNKDASRLEIKVTDRKLAHVLFVNKTAISKHIFQISKPTLLIYLITNEDTLQIFV